MIIRSSIKLGLPLAVQDTTCLMLLLRSDKISVLLKSPLITFNKAGPVQQNSLPEIVTALPTLNVFK